MIELNRELVAKSIARDPRAERQVVDTLLPVVRCRVGRLLRRKGGAGSRDVREETKDLSQQVFTALFAREGHVLRQWDPDRGLSLLSFVGLVAEREVGAILRSRRRSPWTETPTADDDLEQSADSRRGPEQVAAARELAASFREAAQAELSEQGRELFDLFIMEGRTIDEVCAETGMSADRAYAWRSRLGRLLERVAKEVMI
jgi:RNA polymerase sigma-70 factor (ECF subfamily)